MARDYSTLINNMGKAMGGSGEAVKQASNDIKNKDVARYMKNPSNFKTDDERYAAANELAKIELDGKDGVSRNEYKSVVDKYLKELGSEKSGRDIRGDNPWTDFVTGTADAIDAVNNGIGNGIDFVFDNTVGGLAGLIGGEDAGNAVRNFANGSDLAFIPDMASDVLLATIPGAGIPLLVSKEAIRSGDTLGKAFSGKDAITGEKLDDGQRAANLGLGTLGLALSAIPGVGKIKNVANLTSGTMAKKGVEAAKEGVKKADESLGGATRKFSEWQNKFDEASDAYEDAAYNYAKTQEALTPYIKELSPDEGKLFALDDWQGPVKNLKQVESAREAAGVYAEQAKTREAAKDALEKIGAEAPEEMQAALDAKDAARAALKSAEDYGKTGRFKRALDIFKEDTAAMKESFAGRQSVIDEVKNSQVASNDLKKVMRKANKSGNVGKQVDAETGKKVVQEDSDITEALKEAFDDLNADGKLAGEYKDFSDFVEKSGADASKMPTRAFSGKLKTGLPIQAPHPLRPYTAAVRNILANSNSELRYADDITRKLEGENLAKTLDKYTKLAADEQAGEQAMKSASRWLQNYQVAKALKPSGMGDLAKEVGGRAAAIAGMGTLSSAANGGSANPIGALADSVSGAAQSDNIRPGSYLAALMPFFTGKNVARSAIPGISGKLGAYHPYGAIYAKDLGYDMANENREAPRASSVDEAYQNLQKARR